MDVDVYVATHSAEWQRLEVLLRRGRRPRRLAGDEVDELVDLYQRAATHLSVVQSRSPDPVLVARLSSLVARARSVVSGAQGDPWSGVVRFLTVRFPAAVYRSWPWIVATGVGFLAVAFALGVWVDTHRDIQAQLAPPADIRQLVNHDFRSYYSAHPAQDFAAQVWTNNAWVAAVSLAFGVALGLPTLYFMFSNAANVGISGGYLFAAGKGGEFFGLILPHGMLELTALFVAAGVGLRLGWTVVDPGPRRRADALAAEGRAAVTVALGLVLVLAVSGVLEAFVTPSPLPTVLRVGIGAAVWAAFVAYVVVFGRRAVRAGETGDLPLGERPDLAPVTG